jgi:hypothetical protein
MEPALYEKLPSGNSLWEYKHEYASQFVQKPYNNILIQSHIKYVQEPHIKTAPDKKHKNLLNHLIHQIDPLASLYTFQMFNQAEKLFKERVCEFITSDTLTKWLGPKKSRVLLAWLTKNNHGTIDDMGKIVADFLTWFLESPFKYIPENSNIILKDDTTNVYIKYENKQFVIFK